MRHKEQTASDLRTGLPEVIRLQRHAIADPEEMSLEARQTFSKMKYGDPKAVHQIAQALAEILLQDSRLQAWVQTHGQIWLAASAYGSVPSAAATVAQALEQYLRDAGWKVATFKIEREGGFERMNYGALGHSARAKAIRHRKISIAAETALALQGQAVLVIDDLRCTGSHEAAILQMLLQETQVAHLAFGYCITFQGEMEAAQEEKLNHASIRQLGDLMPMFHDASASPLLNARLVKFILRHSASTLHAFWDGIGPAHALALYQAAMSEDGYFDMGRFRAGFAGLEEWLMRSGQIAKRASYRRRSQRQGALAAWYLREQAPGAFIDAETNADMREWLDVYSRFKFGDVVATQRLVSVLVDALVDALQENGSLRQTFIRAKERGEFISLTAPGVRNVISASNLLAREVGLRVNAWLTLQGLPTMVIRTLGRLSSGRANYAELSAKERASREKTTQTIIPRSEYQAFPSHVIFMDDVEVSGQTSTRARQKSLKAGALSFHAVFAFKVDPQQAAQDAGIEHRMNQYTITGRLDAPLAEVLSHADYQPVQRMLRLLLHPRNFSELTAFLQAHVSDRILSRLYLGAMANDYLWIHADGPDAQGEYAPSLQLLGNEMQRRGLMSADGRLRD